ncbi:MAG: amidophosphoribosyltransferase [Oscillospiraceae bacterium]|nr:amidophosphoribosyltransferase [Oscillospiraceae bacterium]
MDKFKEECGVFGIFNNDEDILKTSEIIYFGLFALQHRGQESAGIAIHNESKIKCHKGMGLLPNVFDESILNSLKGNIGIGHVKYSMSGENCLENTQPISTKNIAGNIAVAYNGNLINAGDLRMDLEKMGFIFQTTTDAEVIIALLSVEMAKNDNIEEALTEVMGNIQGAYAVTIMTKDKLIAVRDPLGMRPITVGKLRNSYIVASETCAFDLVGAEFIKDVEPGEIVIIDKDGIKSVQAIKEEKTAACIFEFIYFARPDSVIDGANVYDARFEAGRLLAQECKIDADIVIGVPDSGLPSAQGYAMELGLPYSEGFIKNRYIGRTFIQPSQFMRERSVSLKLNPLKKLINGKRVVMLDDSIVRGTTSKKIVDILRKAGAKEIHFLVASPPIRCCCYFGIDTPHRKHLIADTHSVEEIKETLGVDSLHYISLEKLIQTPVGAKLNFCTACFDGSYPMEIG